MKLASKLISIIILATLLMITSGCEKTHIYEAVTSEDANPEEAYDLSKKKDVTRGWNCRGYAIWKTGLPSYYETSKGYIPTNLFSETDDSTDAVICEWGSYHAAYIRYIDGEGDLYVSEFGSSWNPQIQDNCYEPPYDHPLSPYGVTKWWEKDPSTSLSVNISGPTSLDPGVNGTFTANPSGGCLEYENYRWWKRNDGEAEGEGGILAPPVGQWLELDEWEGYKTIQQSATYNFSLKCEVEDYWGAKADDTHGVTMN